MYTFFSCGDINGIGPEIAVKTFNQLFAERKRDIIFVCPANVFEELSASHTLNFSYQIIKPGSENKLQPGMVNIVSFGEYEISPGIPTVSSGKAACLSLKHTLEMADKKIGDCLITAPLSKEAIGLAGVNFAGHTELLADWYGTKDYMMIFLSDDFIAALMTIHISISSVSSSISAENIKRSLKLLHSTLKNDFDIAEPQIALLGLNPHAGENGRIGNEEKDIIIPAAAESNIPGISGPFVPDAFFANRLYKKFNAVLGMYHDQVLIPFKMLHFNDGVNFTAGLPIVRTSPDHGTAFDIAWKNRADHSSMISSYNWAERISGCRKKNTL